MHGIFYLYLAYAHDTSEIAEHALTIFKGLPLLNPLHPTPKDLKQSQPGGAWWCILNSPSLPHCDWEMLTLRYDLDVKPGCKTGLGQQEPIHGRFAP